jgi:hypothetical protein
LQSIALISLFGIILISNSFFPLLFYSLRLAPFFTAKVAAKVRVFLSIHQAKPTLFFKIFSRKMETKTHGNDNQEDAKIEP